MKLVTSEQMRAIEEASFASGTTQPALMEAAGAAVAHAVRERLAGARAKRILILVGPGNNGGDGLVAARYLEEEGADVRVYLLAPRSDDDPNLQAVRERDIDVVPVDASNVEETLARDLVRADAVLDAVLGIGRQRPLEGVVAAAFVALAGRRCPLFAVDAPTGVHPDDGSVDAHAARTDATFALGFSKLGLHLLPGSMFAGDVEVLDIGLDAALGGRIDVEIMTAEWARSALPERPLVSNKGTFGRVLVVAGSEQYTGAAVLCCMGALRAGAGLVTLAGPPAVRAAVASQLPEATYLPLPDTPDDAGEAASIVARALDGYDVLLIGPGLGQERGVPAMVRGLLSSPAIAATPAVIDADALNALAPLGNWHESLTGGAVLTPHPGEMARLMHSSVPEVQADRIETARTCVARWRQTLVLKGAQTVVASTEGPVRLSPFANSALATAGTGDVLAGAIAGLIAQGVDEATAAALGVYLHGAAGELFAEEYGASGLLAGELGAGIARASARLRRGG